MFLCRPLACLLSDMFLDLLLLCLYLWESNPLKGEGNGTPLHYSCLENPWTEESGGLQSMGSPRVRHDWATSLSLFTFMHWRRKWQPTPVFLPGESQGWGAWWAAIYGVAQSRTRPKRLSSSSSSNPLKAAGPRRPCLLVARWIWCLGDPGRTFGERESMMFPSLCQRSITDSGFCRLQPQPGDP